MKSIKKDVSRTVETGSTKVERKTSITYREAEDVNDMLTICGGSLANVLKKFNEGRWSELRVKGSNALAGVSDEQKSVNKMISAFAALNPSLSEDQVRSLVLSMPGIKEAAEKSASPLPAEIDETYFDKDEVSTPAAAA